jgi:drug/metabolite transporter (DMT)-like permease
VKTSKHLTAILQAAFVTFLWSTSWVLIKFGLRANIPALTFAGLRYSLAFLCILPFILLNPTERAALKDISRDGWQKLILLGIIFYSITQGTQFLGLKFLPAVMVNLLLNLSPVAVALLALIGFGERPTGLQWLGIALCLGGALVYFLPVNVSGTQVLGILIALVGVAANACSSLLGRQVNQGKWSALLVTCISMGIGSALLLATGVLTQGWGSLSFVDWMIILWLAVVNTAVAFTLWNRSLQVLTAVESSIINSLMMPQIALLAVLFLGEIISVKEIGGLVLVGAGVLTAQLKRQKG